MKKVKIGFIGGGNMASAIIAGLIHKKIYTPSQIGVSEPDFERRKQLITKYKIEKFDKNEGLVGHAEIILLAVKPQQMGEVLDEIKSFLTPKHLIISIAAGLDSTFFHKKLGPYIRFVRVMPNLCSMIGEGAAALFASSSTTKIDRSLTQKIFAATGKAVFVESEDLLDTVTAVSGSGPAFVYLFIDALIQAGKTHGLPSDLGQELVLQTLIGAAKMVAQSKEPIEDMISRVASKGGTTEAGLKILHDEKFKDVVHKTIEAAAKRAQELRCTS